jgi:anti-sigma B factor antagonist
MMATYPGIRGSDLSTSRRRVVLRTVANEDAATEPAIALSVEHHDQGAVVEVGGDLEFGTAASLRSALIDLAQQGCDPLVVDLKALEFIDSTGLSLLVQAKQRIEAQGQRFALRNPTDRVRRVLEISGLADLFAIETTDDA